MAEAMPTAMIGEGRRGERSGEGRESAGRQAQRCGSTPRTSLLPLTPPAAPPLQGGGGAAARASVARARPLPGRPPTEAPAETPAGEVHGAGAETVPATGAAREGGERGGDGERRSGTGGRGAMAVTVPVEVGRECE